MPATQRLLFPDPKPLVERLGREFFWGLPQGPGVYLMRDATDTVLYVGKAKNLRKRLNSYRVANPDRLARRHLRLLRAVARIEIRDCPDEATALSTEARFLRSLKPKFNRAGTWPGKPRFLAWRCAPQHIELTVFTTSDKEAKGARTALSASSGNIFPLTPEASKGLAGTVRTTLLNPLRPDEGCVGPLGAGALFLRAALARLIRRAVYLEYGFAALPAGWANGKFSEPAVIQCPEGTAELSHLLMALFSGRPEPLCDWLLARIAPQSHSFELAIIAADLETLNEFEFKLPN